VAETTTTAAGSTTSRPPRTTTTTPAATSSTFVPPAGSGPTTTAPPAEQVLDADTGKLPIFVALSLLGFSVAIVIMTVQWVRSRPRRPAAS
jgi:hypothetical protein